MTVYVFRWRKFRPEWHGCRCVLLSRGSMNSARVRFSWGEEAIVSRNALRKAKPGEFE